MAQVPAWTADDLRFFLHGSMSTEVVPETVFRAFIRTYPDMFPKEDLSHLGLIPDPAFGWPVGFSRSQPRHLGGLPSVGINCAVCHVGEITESGTGRRVRVLGMTSLFDAEAFFGGLIGASFRTSDPANLERFLAAYLDVSDPTSNDRVHELLASEWKRQQAKIVAAVAPDSTALKNAESGPFHAISADDLRLDRDVLAHNPDLVKLSTAMLKLFHNMRAALHIPDAPPSKLPPASGPGRNDAFGLLSAVFFGAPQPYGPVKYGLVWNVERRRWVHWDGNTQSPIGRNLLAALGLGAPLLGKHGDLDFALVKRQTDLSEGIHPPRYPFAIDQAAANRGAAPYRAQCASCHDGPESDARLHTVVEIGTDPRRAELFSPLQAERFNKFLSDLETPGYAPSSEPGIRSTQKYWAVDLGGVWARSPYLHNGSVRTMRDLLTSPSERAKSFHRGTGEYDTTHMGYVEGGSYVLDTTAEANSNVGHDYGTRLSDAEKHDLIEYLKTL